MYQCKILSRAEITDVYNRYMKEDFPKDELKPLSMIMSSLDREQYICYGISNGEQLCGYACIAYIEENSRKYCLLDYFATVKEFRSQGIGTDFLKLLRSELSDAEVLLCETESPEGTSGEEKDTRERRIAFYHRSSFIDTGVSASVFGVNYMILELSLQREHTQEEIREYYSVLYRSFLPEKLYNRFITIN